MYLAEVARSIVHGDWVEKMYRLRRIASIIPVLLTSAFFLTSCKDDGSVGSQYSITEDEAAVIVANSFGSSAFTYGCTGQLEELAGIANGGKLQKEAGEQQIARDTVTVTRSKTALYSYNYTIHFSYGLVGSQFEVEYGMRGTYDTPEMSSRDTAYASFQFANLAADTLLANGNYWRLGRQDSKLVERKSFSSDLVATFTDIRVSQSAKTVIGGMVTFTLRERLPDGFIVSFPGTFTYLDHHQALLVINRKTYNVNLDTADITAA